MGSTLSIRCDDFLRLTQEVSELSHTHSAPVTPVGVGGTSHVSELHGTACTVCSHVPELYTFGLLLSGYFATSLHIFDPMLRFSESLEGDLSNGVIKIHI